MSINFLPYLLFHTMFAAMLRESPKTAAMISAVIVISDYDGNFLDGKAGLPYRQGILFHICIINFI